MNYRAYNLIILIPLGILFAVYISLAPWVEPLEGDLTRLGGFTENDFGWNEPQQQFSSPLVSLEGKHEYDQYHDVVVLGDSFSEAYPKAQWQNYFVRGTGLSLTLPGNQTTLPHMRNTQNGPLHPNLSSGIHY